MQSEDTVLIPLRARDGSVRAYTLIDATDADLIAANIWRLHSLGYAYRSVHEGTREVAILMHRFLMGLPPGRYGPEVDHVNRSRLDNRRRNLRVVPHAGNMQNIPALQGRTSAYRGVYWDRRKRQWAATVHVNRKRLHIGRFKTETEAADAAKSARLRLMPFATD